MINWLKLNWILLTTILTIGIAWGETVTKVQTISDAVVLQSQNQTEIVKLKEGQSRLDERTKIFRQNKKNRNNFFLKLLDLHSIKVGVKLRWLMAQ